MARSSTCMMLEFVNANSETAMDSIAPNNIKKLMAPAGPCPSRLDSMVLD